MIKKIRNYFENAEISFLKAAVYYIICQFLIKGMSFLTMPVFARMLSKTEYGNVSNFFAWQSLIIPLVTLDLRVTINRSKYLYPDDNDSFLFTILIISNIVTICALTFVEVNQSFFVNFFSMDIKYIRLLFFYIIFQTAFDYQQIQYNIYHKYKLYVLYTVLSIVISLILSIILVLTMDNKFEGRILGSVIPGTIINIVIYINILRRSHRIVFNYAKFAVCMALPLIPSALSSTILSASDRIMITNFCGAEQTALYSIAYSVSSIAGIIWASLNQAWGPWLYDHLNEKKYSDIKKYSNRFSLVYAGMVVGIMLISPEIVYAMGGKAYMSSINVMPPVIMAMIFQFFYAFYFNIEYFYGETFIISFGTVISAVVNVGLNYIFIPKYGYIAAAYTTMIGYFIMMLYHYLIVKYKLKKTFIFDNCFFVKTIGILILVQMSLKFIYNNIPVRYGLILLYIMMIIYVGWKNKEIVIQLFYNFFNKKKGTNYV